jgi:NAD(P)-dependent dehydrogenase (short-subunit alcohol dehydrogenase family)
VTGGARGIGRAIALACIATRVRGADDAPYVMSKAALEALGDVLAKEEARNRVRVNVVAPGLVRTDMGDAFLDLIGVDGWDAIQSTFPFGRVCEPDDVANVVRWLVSERGGFVTGQTVYVDGGGAPAWNGVPDSNDDVANVVIADQERRM